MHPDTLKSFYLMQDVSHHKLMKIVILLKIINKSVINL